MQAIMETLFNIGYLSAVTVIGVIMLKGAKDNKPFKLFGLMTLLLGFGDAFHLAPRSYALFTTGIEANAAALGFGKLVTSITMTLFYLMLYTFLKQHYALKNTKRMDLSMVGLAAVRIALCLFPQNNWFSVDQPLSWGIYRNIPFAVMGLIVLVISFIYARRQEDTYYKHMWLAITLSFAFYVPVVLFAKAIPVIGALMIPKTLAYVWIVVMGYRDFKHQNPSM